MKRARRAVALILMLCMLLGMSAYAENESSCDIVEDWDASTDLMDADKYQSTNCTLTLGSDAEVGGYVAMKASNYGPLLTVTAQLAAGKSVGVWVKQANTLEGSVKLLQEGSEVAGAGYTPVKDQWQMVILDVETDADAIRFVPNAYGNPSIGSIYYGTRDALEALAAAKPEPEPDDAVVVEAWGAGTDLTDATKYQANGCTFVGVTSDGAVGGCVEAKPNSYSPSVTVYGDFTAGAYVGVWVKESSVNGGAVKLLSGGSEVAVQQFSSEKDQWTFVMAEIPADSAVDGVNIAPSTTSAFFIGAIYCGSRTALEAIASGGGSGEGDTSDEDCPDQSAPGTPGGEGRWVLVDNFETGRISAYYSEADGVKIVSGGGRHGQLLRLPRQVRRRRDGVPDL